MATGYDITYLPTEPHSHVLLWEHAVKDMDFNTPKNARKTKEKRRLHAYKRYYEKQLGSGKLYLYHIVRDLRRRDMPLELAVISILKLFLHKAPKVFGSLCLVLRDTSS